MRILITNNGLACHAGSELYVRDLATGLLDRGHTPIAYSTVLGEVADELRAATVPVVDDLNSLAVAPDVIHGHHHLETMTALLRFPGVPAVYLCHGWIPWQEAPPAFPRILRYLAVDNTCRDRLLYEHAIPEGQVKVLLNFVDLKRFSRRPPLPAVPKRALVFSNNASEHTHLGIIREACERAGLSVDVIGMLSGNRTANPEQILGRYDIVFAKARSALEALAVGTAVILCDQSGSGPMVTFADLDRLRALNLGIRALRRPVDPEILLREIGRYDPDDAARVTDRVRETAGRDAVIDEIVEIYKEVKEEFSSNDQVDLREEARAASTYLRWLTAELKAKGVQLPSEERNQLLSQIAAQSRLLTGKQAEIDRITGSLGWRLMSRYGPVKHRLVLPLRNALKRMLGL